ncbi:MAG: efflux RND transporter periplasmic adaptor subunit [Paludibacter sp.]
MRRIPLFSIVLFLLILVSCSKKEAKQQTELPVVSVKATPVQFGDIENTVSLNGKTIFLKKNTVASPISGYILKVHVKFGAKVHKNDLLFEIQTKENKALENTDAGIINVPAPANGTINTLTVNATGGYIMEGAELCSIIENKDLMVQVNVPFEYHSLAKPGTKCKLFLADNTSFDGSIFQVLPNVDEANQTQQVLIKPNTNRALPENLNLTVQLVNLRHNHTCLVPTDAVMTNETQTEFWVMKIVNDKMALKVPVKKGITNDHLTEILSSNLTENDLVITDGAYGLNDSTEVIMTPNP